MPPLTGVSWPATRPGPKPNYPIWPDLAGTLSRRSPPTLAKRMYRAARHCFDLGAGRVVIVGTDVPSLPPRRIDRAFDLLAEYEIVLGPSVDGGYYLVGLSTPIREIFRDIAWSTEHVFAQTLERARALRLTAGVLPSWYDVDTPEQLDHLVEDARAHLRSGHADPIPHTRACLSTLNCLD